MASLRKSFNVAPLFNSEIASLPARSIFEKLAKINPELPDRILDQVMKVQLEAHSQPKLQEAFKAALAVKPSWKDIIKSHLDNIAFLFKLKTEPQPSGIPPARIERRVGQSPRDRITRPHEFSRTRLENDDFKIDTSLIGDDLRRAILSYAESHRGVLKLTADERASLEPHA